MPRYPAAPAASIYDIPADETGIAAGARPPSLVGTNDFGEAAYGPPCPPEGDEPHRYVFSLHALPASPGLAAAASPADAVDAIEGSSIGSAELSGTYGR